MQPAQVLIIGRQGSGEQLLLPSDVREQRLCREHRIRLVLEQWQAVRAHPHTARGATAEDDDLLDALFHGILAFFLAPWPRAWPIFDCSYENA